MRSVNLVFVALFCGSAASAESNVAKLQRVTSSGFAGTSIPVYANDGDVDSAWISPDNSGWIDIELDSDALVQRIELVVEQTPAGVTEHVISAAGVNGIYHHVHTFRGHTQAGQRLVYDLAIHTYGIRHIRVTTNSSPSWVAWREIEVWGDSSAGGNNNDCYFGYYWGAGEHPEFENNYMAEFAAHSNFVHIVDDNLVSLVGKLQQARSHGLMAILSPFWTMFASKGELHPNYVTRFAAYADAVAPFADDILGFYPVDEPYWYDAVCHHEVAVQQVYTEAFATIKARFPNKPIVVTFAWPCVTDQLFVPHNADWLSFDRYGTFDPIAGYLAILKSKLNANQRVILTADGFMAGVTGPATPEQQYIWALRARQYRNMARHDNSVLGLWTFIWPSFGEGAGVRDQPLLRADYTAIGNDTLSRCANPAGERCFVRTDCDDGDPCTSDSCNTLLHQCSYSANGTCIDAGNTDISVASDTTGDTMIIDRAINDTTTGDLRGFDGHGLADAAASADAPHHTDSTPADHLTADLDTSSRDATVKAPKPDNGGATAGCSCTHLSTTPWAFAAICVPLLTALRRRKRKQAIFLNRKSMSCRKNEPGPVLVE